MKFNTIIENQSLEMEFSDSLNQFSIKTENLISWEDIPKEARNEFIHSGQKNLNYKLYKRV